MFIYLLVLDVVLGEVLGRLRLIPHRLANLQRYRVRVHLVDELEFAFLAVDILVYVLDRVHFLHRRFFPINLILLLRLNNLELLSLDLRSRNLLRLEPKFWTSLEIVQVGALRFGVDLDLIGAHLPLQMFRQVVAYQVLCFLENFVYDHLVFFDGLRKAFVNRLRRIPKIMYNHIHEQFLLFQVAFELFDLVDIFLPFIIPISI